MSYTTWIEINKNALHHNIAQYKIWLPAQTGIAAVVKANAYGHGAREVSSIHENHPDVVRLCVASSQEGVDLRKFGIKKPILVLGFIDTPISSIAKYDLDMLVSDLSMIKDLNKIGKKHQKKINIHLKIDTGLSRLGILPEQFSIFIHAIETMPFLNLQGICSHLIECIESTVHEQEELLRPFYKQGLQFHTTNSNGSLVSKYIYSFARIGAGLYGYLPEADAEKQQLLEPIIALKTRVIGIKPVPAGGSVGYARTYKAHQPTKVAVLGMGYYEGIDPDLANTGKVLLHGQFAPIVGRINMNYFTVDVTHIPQTKMHDVATVLGQDGNNKLSVYDWRIGAKKNVRMFLARFNQVMPRIIVDQPVIHMQTHSQQNVII